MAKAAPTFGQIRAQVANIRKRASDAHVFGIYTNGRWTGQALQQFGGETYYIAQCDSMLAMRVALQEATSDAAATVLVTGLPPEHVECGHPGPTGTPEVLSDRQLADCQGVVPGQAYRPAYQWSCLDRRATGGACPHPRIPACAERRARRRDRLGYPAGTPIRFGYRTSRSGGSSQMVDGCGKLPALSGVL